MGERPRDEFLEDLDVLQEGKDHYTGTIVLHGSDAGDRRLDTEGRSYSALDVVDGQQRLTTVLLLLDAIRRALGTLRDETQTLADGIQRTYVSATEINGQPLFKLTLNSDCDHYFRTVSLSDSPGPEGPQISSDRRLAEVRDEFQAYINQARTDQGDDFQEWLTTLYRKVPNQLTVSLYEVESAADVGVIFEVMNNCGKPLSELEKVKNYLLYAGSTLSVDHDLLTS